MAKIQEQGDLVLARRLQGNAADNNNVFDIEDDEVLYSALDAITDDYIYALQLQEELNTTCKITELPSKPILQTPVSKTSIVDESWEFVDPTPDIFALFKQFNQTYFWGKLDGVEVRWSPKMTLCAGVCSYEGRGGLCSVRLSLPLLKLRPRKDLVQTLLHEMIHAYLFVTQNNKDHDAHGPEFCKHMQRLNKETGANITVYHTFHDEVELYRQHWWKCNGPCQKRPPYYGILRRATNRAPGPNDPWWKDHEKLCGGTYIKFKEPEGYKDPKRKNGEPTLGGLKSPSPKKSKGPTQQLITPFSGKGHVLGSVNPGKHEVPNRNVGKPSFLLGESQPRFSPTQKVITSPSSSGHVVNPRSDVATLHLKSPNSVSSSNTNIVTFGSRQPLGSNQATRLKSNSSSTLTITQRKPAATANSPRSTASSAKGVKPKSKSVTNKKSGSPSKLQSLREMFTKMQNSPPKRWSNGKLRTNTVVRRVSSSGLDQDEHSLAASGPLKLSGCSGREHLERDERDSKKIDGINKLGNFAGRDNLNIVKAVGLCGSSSSIEPRGTFNQMGSSEHDKRDVKSATAVTVESKLKNTGKQDQQKTSSGNEKQVNRESGISVKRPLCECPVCHQFVAESDINEHLDTKCLTA